MLLQAGGLEREGVTRGERREETEEKPAEPAWCRLRRRRRASNLAAAAPSAGNALVHPQIILHRRRRLPTHIKSGTCRARHVPPPGDHRLAFLLHGQALPTPTPRPPALRARSVHGSPPGAGTARPACAGGAEEGEEPRGRPTAVPALPVQAARTRPLASWSSAWPSEPRGGGGVVCRALQALTVFDSNGPLVLSHSPWRPRRTGPAGRGDGAPKGEARRAAGLGLPPPLCRKAGPVFSHLHGPSHRYHSGQRADVTSCTAEQPRGREGTGHSGARKIRATTGLSAQGGRRPRMYGLSPAEAVGLGGSSPVGTPASCWLRPRPRPRGRGPGGPATGSAPRPSGPSGLAISGDWPAPRRTALHFPNQERFMAMGSLSIQGLGSQVLTPRV